MNQQDIPRHQAIYILDSIEDVAHFLGVEIVWKPTAAKAVRYIADNYEKTPVIITITSIKDVEEAVDFLEKYLFEFNRTHFVCVFREGFLFESNRITDKMIPREEGVSESLEQPDFCRQYKHLRVIK